MKLAIATPQTEFSKELTDLVLLFFPEIVLGEGEADLCLCHTEQLEGENLSCTVSFSGLITSRATLSGALSEDPLMRKRLHKRLVKRCAYEALKTGTGSDIPWGSLTGIRPTRLVYERMEGGESLPAALHEVQALFDVSEEKIRLLNQIIEVQQLLSLPGSDEVNLYVGIPFCTTRCRYCSFLSCEVGNGRLLEPYVEALLREIEAVSELIQEKKLKIRAFYMGGGTPTALPPPLLRRVLKQAQPLIARAREATVEAGRPDTICRDKLEIILESGARRISVNPQTAHDETLRRIGRAHTWAQTLQAYQMACDAGFRHINMDLIAGLPGEDLSMFSRTLDEVLALHPQSLTVHTLSVKRSSDMHRLQEGVPREAGIAAMVQQAAERAQRQGLLPYYLYRQKHQAENLENVGYALPGHACLYNIDTMEDVGSVIAMGAGGISKRVWPGRLKVVRTPNIKDVPRYIERIDEMIQRKKELWSED